VEDGPDNRRLITYLLRRAGAEVDIAEDGRAGAEKVLTAWGKGAPYDAVLMDMQMPVMDGYQATRYLREKGYAGPIIALTAHSMAGDREKCLAAGCNDFASKPVSREEVLRTIRRHLSPPAVGNAGGTASSGSLVSELAGDAEMADIVEMFVAELPGKIAAIEDALARQDLATLGAIAHQLKGAAGGYGFPSITEAAMALEVGAKAQEDLDSLRQRLEALADLCQRARAGAMRRPTERDEPTRPIA
jgi:CheY-like chemotaxis protein